MEKLVRGMEFANEFSFNNNHCALVYKMCEMCDHLLWIILLYGVNLMMI